MKQIIYLILFIICLSILSFPVKADNKGSITISVQPSIDFSIESENQSKYGISTHVSIEQTKNFTPINIRITNVNDSKETIFWQSQINTADDIRVPLDNGTYKLYVQREGDDRVLEYNNDSEGYIITPQTQLIIPLYFPAEGYDLDAPWRIENSEIYIPILAVDNDGLTLADINNIYVYDHNNGDAFIASTNWSSPQPIDNSNIPFLYMFRIDKNLFTQVNGNVSIKIKFDLHLAFDNWEGPLSVKISPYNVPTLTDWYSGDTHLHTNYTHNSLEYGAPIEETKTAAKAMGLDWTAITDHSFDLDPEKWDARRNDLNAHSDNLFRVIEGEEVSVYLHGTNNPPLENYNYNVPTHVLEDF